MTVAAMASNSMLVAVVVETEERLAAVMIPARPASIAPMMKVLILTLLTGTPVAVAALMAPPTA